MAHAVRIDRDEMVDFLMARGFTPVTLANVTEEVWGKLEGGVCIRVYTTIQDGTSRVKGSDAIRVAVVWRVPGPEKKIVAVGSSKRVHRVAGWRENLGQRLDNWKDMLGGKCPKCGAPEVMRTVKKDGKNKGKKFWSCAAWSVTKCEHFAWAEDRSVASSK